MNAIDLINKIYTLPSESGRRLEEFITEATFPKGHILLRENKIERDIYFIKQGIVRAYTCKDGDEVTFWFGKEGEVILSMRSYIQNQKSYETIELLEDCLLYKLPTDQLQQLFREDIHIANWGRKLAEQELIQTEKRLISRQFSTAAERYEELIQHDPQLLQRVQLGHIASYLGITQVSLSRIRAGIK
ncbi:Crp/Fnr family transcriptional regulator [Bacteroides reticulotermitis]|uniref:cAMP-binding proteins n=2 Tax=Bacteroides reticulotermitis TaxID=1133319 RepID=W4UYX2_9BACE|nr:Crp/Fnr family transcriptional regulator [Bacteroides reticulotermitis]MBB4043072.1 CRP-like cAMP-binding protein [Bacteroides reticulotermitis]GAE85783.1 cAMP-binding proteins [Bacteroides reticulotermitis JCM 10512]HJD75880.1 Crp/Fnr family transcriptional regulator [Bacteroides reticulotermitis]